MKEIIDVRFIGDDAMMLFLSNGALLIPLDKFEDLKGLSSEQKLDFEVIDGENLSFLAIDDIYNIHGLTGL
jgi:hypothetical protein